MLLYVSSGEILALEAQQIYSHNRWIYDFNSIKLKVEIVYKQSVGER